jgi:hypothetical protein
MGWNTTVVIMNDGIDAIGADPEFGAKLRRAVIGFRVHGARDVPAGNHCNPCRVIEQHHADDIIAVAVGGNTGQILGYIGGYTLDLTTENGQRNALEALASKYGYRLTKKPHKGSNGAAVTRKTQ